MRGAQNSGFSLVEIAVVIAVIGVLVGAMSIGNRLYQTATYTEISSRFVRGWQVAYDSYLERTGSVPGDDDNDGLIDSTSCGNSMLDEFLQAGVELPSGRAEGENDRYVYEDSNGIPQSLQLCIRPVRDWKVPGASTGSFNERPRNVLEIRNLTPSLARRLDSMIDGRVDARFGRLREQGEHDADATGSQDWSLDATDSLSGTRDDEDEAQVATLTAYYRMRR